MTLHSILLVALSVLSYLFNPWVNIYQVLESIEKEGNNSDPFATYEMADFVSFLDCWSLKMSSVSEYGNENISMDETFQDNTNLEIYVKNVSRLKNKKQLIIGKIYNPESMRGLLYEFVMSKENSNIGFQVSNGMWIKGNAIISGNEKTVSTFIDSVLRIAPPEMEIEAIMLEKTKNRNLIEILSPDWMKGTRVYLKTEPALQQTLMPMPGEFFKTSVNITHPDYEFELIEPCSTYVQDIQIEFFVERIEMEDGLLYGQVLSPGHQNFNILKIPIKQYLHINSLKEFSIISVNISVPLNGQPIVTAFENISEEIDFDHKNGTFLRNQQVDPGQMTNSISPAVWFIYSRSKPQEYFLDTRIVQLETSVMNQSSSSESSIFHASSIVYENCREVEELEPEELHEITLDRIYLEPGFYKIENRISCKDCGSEESKIASSEFQISESFPVKISSGLSFQPKGLGNTTGKVVALTIENSGKTSGYVSFGACLIPSINGFQSYLIPDRYQIFLAPHESRTIDLYGYCTMIALPPVPKDGVVAPFEDWLFSSEVNNYPLPEEPVFSNYFNPVVKDEIDDNISLCYLGTKKEFPFEISINKDLLYAAPLIFTGAELLHQELFRSLRIEIPTTPLSGDFERLVETVLQQCIWIFANRLDQSRSSVYDRKGFFERTLVQMQNNAGLDLSSLNGEEIRAIEKGIESLWSVFLDTGYGAGVFHSKKRILN